MHKMAFAMAAAALTVFLLVSCNSLPQPAPSSSPAANSAGADDGGRLDKLHAIEKDWTSDQVYTLLGMPDRYGERSVVAEVFYTVDPTTEAVIAFWDEGIQIELYNSETGERTPLLD